MFADIAGFTAWSSTREPAQVFTLLETFYKAFDAIASRRGIFKVEVSVCVAEVCDLLVKRLIHYALPFVILFKRLSVIV